MYYPGGNHFNMKLLNINGTNLTSLCGTVTKQFEFSEWPNVLSVYFFSNDPKAPPTITGGAITSRLNSIDPKEAVQTMRPGRRPPPLTVGNVAPPTISLRQWELFIQNWCSPFGRGKRYNRNNKARLSLN